MLRNSIFFRRNQIILYYTIWARSLISRLQKYCTAAFIWKIVWKMFMWIYYALFRCFSYRDKVINKDIHNIIVNGYTITIIKGEYSIYTGCYSFQRINGFDSFLCVLNLFFADIDFCKPRVVQGLDLNFNLYLLILLRGA